MRPSPDHASVDVAPGSAGLRKARSREFHAREKWLHRAVRDAVAGYFFIDKDGCFRWVNDAWLGMHGYSRAEEVVGRHFSLTQVESDLEGAADIVKLLMSGVPVSAGEFNRKRKDGSIGYHTFSVRPVKHGDRVVGLEGFLIDTTATHELQERFAAAFYHAPVPMAIHAAADGRVLEVNQEFETFFGHSREEAIGRTTVELGLVTPAEWARLAETLSEQGRLLKAEYPLRLKDGRIAIGDLDAAPITFGGIPAILSVTVDVTERRQHERESGVTLGILRLLNTSSDTRELLQALTGFLQESSGCDAVGFRLRDGSDFPYYETRGFPQEFVQAESRLCARDAEGELLRDSAGEALLECMCGAVLSGRVDPSLPFFTRNGSFWTNSTSDLLATTPAGDLPPLLRGRCHRQGYESVALVPLRFAGRTIGLMQFNNRRRGSFTAGTIGFFERVAGTIATALEQRRAQAELRESEQFNREVIAGAQEGVVVYDRQLRYQVWNPFMEAFTGMPAAQVLGRCALDLFPHLREHHLDEALQRALAGETVTFPGTPYRVAQTDRSGWVSGVYGPHLDAHGNIVGVIGLLHDVSQQKRAEEERRTLQEELFQAQKLESIGRLAGGIAHDFNNLLTVINGYSDLVLGRLAAGDPLRDWVAEIRRAGERAAGLTRQLLTFSRKQVAEPKPLNLNHLIAEARNMLGRLLGEDVELLTNLAPTLGLVMADPGQIHQVLMNLMVNARDAMPDGGRLTIETAHVELDPSGIRAHGGVDPRSYVMLAVTDTGFGMDQETRERLFEPFFTTKGEGKGTGLGLATAYGIVRQCGGWIWADSQPGQGATFKICLPGLADSCVAEQPVTPAPGALRGSETVLVVEDQPEVRRLAVEVLKSYGYRVLEAAMAGEALLLAERHPGPIHLMITDVIMPFMTGRDLAERLGPLRPEMAVLYVSGYTGDVIAHQGALDAGVSYIPKPFAPEALAVKVRELLG